MGAQVVVGYDGSERSAAAVRWAAQEAARTASPVLVVHVWGFAGQPSGGAGTSRLGAQVIAGIQEIAEDGARVARQAAPELPVTGTIGHGSPAQVLVDLSEGARLLVLGRRGAGWFTEALTGSVTAAVVQRASCPVVVVPHESAERESAGLVVVGIDGSPGADGALDAAATHARERGARLRVLTAWVPHGPRPTMSYWSRAYPDLSPDDVAQAEAERIQEEARESFAGDFPDVEVAWDIEAGPPATVLVEASKAADLTVVGARGSGGLAGLMVGSVSRGVVRHAHGPVLVTRSAV